MSSSNNLKFKISLSNYEEKFLLYVDEELSAEERTAVEAFVAANPQLKEELDLLSSTKLPVPDLELVNKSELFSGRITMKALDEALLFYIDNELSEAEKMQMEVNIARNPDYRLQYQRLLKTKSDASETILFPHKKSLYKTPEGRMVPVWLRIAAVVLLLAGSGAVLWNGNPTSTTLPVAEVTHRPAQKAGEEPMLPAPVLEQPNRELPSFAASPEDENKGKAKPGKASAVSLAATREVKTKDTQRSNRLPVPQTNDKEAIAVQAQKQIPETAQQTYSSPVVTTTEAGTFNHQQTTNTQTVFTSNTEPANPEKGGSLKGLLRKATRFIERRTGIAATNEHDELLIGGVAIKLK